MSARSSEGGVLYLDSSAIVKLVLAEPESEALRRYLLKAQGTRQEDMPRCSSRCRVVPPL